MWCKMREEFDLDPSRPNPYAEPESRKSRLGRYLFPNLFLDFSMAELRLQLLKEEAQESSEGQVQGQVQGQVLAGAFLRQAFHVKDRR